MVFLPVIMWVLFGEVSSFSGCLGWATLFYYGTPWAFHIIIYYSFKGNVCFNYTISISFYHCEALFSNLALMSYPFNNLGIGIPKLKSFCFHKSIITNYIYDIKNPLPKTNKKSNTNQLVVSKKIL